MVLSAKGRTTKKQCQRVQVQLSRTVPSLDGQPRTQTWVHPHLLPASRIGQPGEQPGSQAQVPYLRMVKKIKLQISEQDAATLEFMQGKCRGLYNWWVMKLRDGEKWPGWEEAKKTLQESCEYDGVLAIDLGIKTLATGITEQGRVYQIGGFKGGRWYNTQLDKIRSKRDRCKKGSRRYKHLSQVYKRVSQQKRNKQQDSLHKASHLIVHKTVASTIVIGDLSQRQMVTKQHQEKNQYRNRMVYNEWGLYTFVQMLVYKCVLAGKALVILDERDTTKTCCQCGHKQAMPLWKRVYRCKNPECRLVIDRDVNSAINYQAVLCPAGATHGRFRAVCGRFHRNRTSVRGGFHRR